MFSLSTLSIRLRRIALLTQHLQVVIRGMPALAPRNDVVTFHVLKGVLGVDATRGNCALAAHRRGVSATRRTHEVTDAILHEVGYFDFGFSDFYITFSLSWR